MGDITFFIILLIGLISFQDSGIFLQTPDERLHEYTE